MTGTNIVNNCGLCRLWAGSPQRPGGGARFTLPAPLSKFFPNEFPYTYLLVATNNLLQVPVGFGGDLEKNCEFSPETGQKALFPTGE
jgi:hypothetical protein